MLQKFRLKIRGKKTNKPKCVHLIVVYMQCVVRCARVFLSVSHTIQAVKQYLQIIHWIKFDCLNFRAGMRVWCQKTHHCYLQHAAAAAPNLFDMEHTLVSLLHYYYLNNNKTVFDETQNDTPNDAMCVRLLLLLLLLVLGSKLQMQWWN